MKRVRIKTVVAAGSAGMLLGTLWLACAARLPARSQERVTNVGSEQSAPAASSANTRRVRHDPPPARVQPLHLTQPFTIVYKAAVEWDNKQRMVKDNLRLTLSYDGQNLLYLSENLATHVTRICLYNGKETHIMDSNSGISEIDPGFDFSRLLYCPLPGVGIPKMPFFTRGFPPKILAQVVQVTATNVHSEPQYVDAALYQTPRRKRDYGLFTEMDRDAGDFRPGANGMSGLGSVVTVPSSGIPRALWYETFSERGKPYLGRLWEFYRHAPFQGVWLARRIKMRLNGGLSKAGPRPIISAVYSLQSATGRPLAARAYDATTYLLKHANITDFTVPSARSFLYEPSGGSLEFQRSKR